MVPDVVESIRAAAAGKRVMLNLDSDHAAAHVLSELRLLADLVSPGCYLIVEDTAIGKPLGKHLLPGPEEALEEWLGRAAVRGSTRRGRSSCSPPAPAATSGALEAQGS